jgi:O-methyltransferase
MSAAKPTGTFEQGQIQRAIGAARRRVASPSAAELRKSYIDLLEKAVQHTLYYPTDKGELPEYWTTAIKAALAEKGVTPKPASAEAVRAEGRDWPLFAQTMIGTKRLRNVRSCVQRVIADGVEGDLIEAGCWRGGTTILMRGIVKAHGENDRIVFAADSFQGVPEPDRERFPADAEDLNFTADALAVSREEVEANFERYGLLDDGVRFLEGWFKDTLPTVANRKWAVIRLDGDLYESITDSLENLYDGVSPGGFVIIDDYCFDNCRAAVDDFRAKRGISDPIEQIDWNASFWRKSA